MIFASRKSRSKYIKCVISFLHRIDTINILSKYYFPTIVSGLYFCKGGRSILSHEYLIINCDRTALPINGTDIGCVAR